MKAQKTTHKKTIALAANDDSYTKPPTPPANIADTIAIYENNTLSRLADINTGIEQKTHTINDLISLIVPEIPKIINLCQQQLNNHQDSFDYIDKNRLSRCFGMSVASLEKCLQTAGEIPGSSFNLLPAGIDKMMLILGENLRGNARDDHFVYWGLDRFIPYTSHQGEKEFAYVVKLSNNILNKSANNLRAIIQKRIDLDSHEASVLLTEIVSELTNLHNAFKELDFKLGRDGFFAMSMRQFLLPIKIGEKLHQGPNAKFYPGFARCDLVFGIKNDRYLTELKARLPFMTSEDKSVLEKELNLDTSPSLIEFLLGTIQPIENVNDHITLAMELSKLPRTFRQNLLTISRIAKLWIEISGIHLALIQKHLVNVKQTAKPINLPVPLSEGVSGASLQQVFDLHKLLRQHSWANTTFVKAVRMLAE